MNREVKMEHQYSYSLDDYNTLTIWEDNCTLATISDVRKKEAEELFVTIVYELRGIDLDEVEI